LDALINNAGVAQDGVLAMMPEEQIERMLQVNLQAALLLTKECVRWMLLQGQGNIISVSSILAERGFSGLAAYAATKAGLIGMTRSLARELGPRQIRVNAIAPGYVETEMSDSLDMQQRQQIIRRTPLGRLATTEDIVPVVEFLLSPASQFITGQTIVVDGGASV
jgi:3-oxoacyl-[acyl-carrier protein] reductase